MAVCRPIYCDGYCGGGGCRYRPNIFKVKRGGNYIYHCTMKWKSRLCIHFCLHSTSPHYPMNTEWNLSGVRRRGGKLTTRLNLFQD